MMTGMKRAVSIVLALIAGLPAALPAQVSGPQNAAYVELLGNGGLLSINYDRKLSDRFSLRAGVGNWGSEGTGWDDRKVETTMTTVPLLANYLGGSGSGRLELGAGVLFGHRKRESSFSEPDVSYTFTSLTGVVGYRYQPSSRGLMFRAGATPILGLGDSDTAYPEKGLVPSIGLSAGYTF
jgi:hypothetical protein